MGQTYASIDQSAQSVTTVLGHLDDRTDTLMSCFSGTSAPGAAPAERADAPSSDTVVATIGDQKITLADLDKKAKPQLLQLEAQMHQAREMVLDTMIFFRYTPFDALGLAFSRSATSASRFSFNAGTSNEALPMLQ